MSKKRSRKPTVIVEDAVLPSSNVDQSFNKRPRMEEHPSTTTSYKKSGVIIQMDMSQIRRNATQVGNKDRIQPEEEYIEKIVEASEQSKETIDEGDRNQVRQNIPFLCEQNNLFAIIGCINHDAAVHGCTCAAPGGYFIARI